MATALSGAADSSGPALTPAQRRLLVAAGAGIPARLLSSRPSQQAQALAQQPLRGAWRAGATYRPALRAAATAALTAAALEPAAPAANPLAPEALAHWATPTHLSTLQQMYSLVERDRIASQPTAASTKANQGEGARNERSPKPSPAAQRKLGLRGASGGDNAEGGGEADDSVIQMVLGLGTDQLKSMSREERERLRQLASGQRLFDEAVPTLVYLVSGSAADTPEVCYSADFLSCCTFHRLAWRLSVMEGAHGEQLPSDEAEREGLRAHLSSHNVYYVNYPHRVLAGRALLLTRLGNLLVTAPEYFRLMALHDVRLSTQCWLDSLVYELSGMYGKSEDRGISLTELRLLTFLLASLHERACSYRVDADLRGSGPRLGPVPAHLTSMGVLIRIVRYAAERFLHVPLPPEWQASDAGSHPTGGKLTAAKARAALAVAPARWAGGEGLLSEDNQRKIMRAVALLHWPAAIDPKVAEAVQEAVAAGGGSLDDVEALAGALESPRTKAGRVYASAVRRVRSNMVWDHRSSHIGSMGADVARKLSDGRSNAEAIAVAKMEWDEQEWLQLDRALTEMVEWLPEAVLQPLRAAPAEDQDDEEEELAGQAGAPGGEAATQVGAAPAAVELRSEALGRLLPRMELTRLIGDKGTVAACGVPATALAVGAAAAANALRDWLGTVFAPLVMKNPSRRGAVHPYSRRPALPPWKRAPANGITRARFAGSDGNGSAGSGWKPFAWLRTEAMVLGVTLAVREPGGPVEVTRFNSKPDGGVLTRTVAIVLEAACRLEPAPLNFARCVAAQAEEESGRVASLAAAVEAAILRDGAAVVDVGGGGGTDCYGPTRPEQTRRRRQAAEAELADAVEALAQVWSRLPKGHGCILVPVPYGGLGSTTAVRHACASLMNELLTPVVLPDGEGERQPAIPDEWASLLFSDSESDSDSDDDSDGPDRLDKLSLLSRWPAYGRGLGRGVWSSWRRQRAAVRAQLRDEMPRPFRVSARERAMLEYGAGLMRASCGLLGVTPLPSAHDPLVDEAHMTVAAREIGEWRQAHHMDEEVRQMSRDRARRVLDVGELAEAGIALVVVGKAKQRKTWEEMLAGANEEGAQAAANADATPWDP
ncbi:hypothetical protein HYH03_009711 [Edaphochlamys debaryana]|uniref:Uncharacterized protein n=1 Tax=Edaphochlamys debaryana TaxID=47281 RepID=A0A836BWY2_9CHLO|nr:hypothetical protein HYH03_009711 [Edaphochlamys debaryana]|eukprot:KAG2491980.1 hypothetical protein HYH03_009711 [Edaphochlamys debaryana]